MTISENTKKALQDRLAEGFSTRQIGEQKQRLALAWLYRWGWSWPDMLEQIGGAKGNRLSARLEKNKLITTMVPEAAGMAGVPKKLVVLSQTGLQEAERFQQLLMRYELDPHRIRHSHVRHGVLCQKSTANMLSPHFSFKTERELAQLSKKDIKQPDVFWDMDGLKVAVEVELTSKWSRHMDQFILSTVQSLLPSGNTPARFDRMFLFTDSPAIRENYQEQFQPGYVFNKWARDGGSNLDKWKVTGKYQVPASIEGKVVCRLFE